MDIKNPRLLPSAQFEFVDNGVLLTIVDSMSGNVAERKVHEELTEALKTYRDICTKVAKALAKAESKEENKEDKESDDLDG